MAECSAKEHLYTSFWCYLFYILHTDFFPKHFSPIVTRKPHTESDDWGAILTKQNCTDECRNLTSIDCIHNEIHIDLKNTTIRTIYSNTWCILHRDLYLAWRLVLALPFRYFNSFLHQVKYTRFWIKATLLLLSFVKDTEHVALTVYSGGSDIVHHISSCHITTQKTTIHQLTTMLSTSKYVLYSGYNHLLTTGADDMTLSLSPKRQRSHVATWKQSHSRPLFKAGILAAHGS